MSAARRIIALGERVNRPARADLHRPRRGKTRLAVGR
jgi:hypothetical protein